MNYFEWGGKITDRAWGFYLRQVDKETGKPAWVIPLTWSHAMFVLVLEGLLGVGEFKPCIDE